MCEPLSSMRKPFPPMCEPLPSMRKPFPPMFEPLASMSKPFPPMCEPLASMCEPFPSVFKPLTRGSKSLASMCETSTQGKTLCPPRPGARSPASQGSIFPDEAFASIPGWVLSGVEFSAEPRLFATSDWTESMPK